MSSLPTAQYGRHATKGLLEVNGQDQWAVGCLRKAIGQR